MKKDYITITGMKHFFGTTVFRVGDVISCEKEFDNDFDEEAIKVMMKAFGKVGYIANSSGTVAKGTKSAGRIYDKVGDKFFVRVCFVTGGSVIAEVVNRDVKIYKSNRKIRK
ncbi:MAG: DNA-binding protein [Gemella haemolysans]|uniref:DNA-binding protein n=1 Tax=Gemella haemolysans TaxID=1379 RepID=UPI003F9ECC5D